MGSLNTNTTLQNPDKYNAFIYSECKYNVRCLCFKLELYQLFVVSVVFSPNSDNNYL